MSSSLTQSSTNGRSFALNGALTAVCEGRISGWAADTNDLSRRLSMDLYVDGCLVRKAVADRFSTDAQVALGEAMHGFEIELPVRLLDGGVHYLTVAPSGVKATLPDGADFGEHNVSQPDGTRFERMLWGEQAPQLPGPCLIEGRDGWAFLCNDANGSLDQLLGDLLFTDADVRLYRDILLARHEALADIGIPYLFAIAPSKETIHIEALPDTIAPQLRPALAGQLGTALIGSEVRLVDLHGPLRSAALKGETVYYRRDCHWNWPGGLIASHALLEEVRSAGLASAHLDEDQLSWKSSSYRGDLVGKPRTRFLEGRLLQIDGGSEPDVLEADRRPDLEASGVRTVDTPEYLEVSKTRRSVVLINDRRTTAPRAIVYRDSFGEHLRPFLGAAFSRSVWLWRPSIDITVIERERPDVVIQVVAERFLANIPTHDVLAH
jgi:hypothetical protein